MCADPAWREYLSLQPRVLSRARASTDTSPNTTPVWQAPHLLHAVRIGAFQGVAGHVLRRKIRGKPLEHVHRPTYSACGGLSQHFRQLFGGTEHQLQP